MQLRGSLIYVVASGVQVAAVVVAMVSSLAFLYPAWACAICYEANAVEYETGLGGSRDIYESHSNVST